jgi:uncharacterized membrane protein AbrB (regulator of aidB expression)
MPLFGTDGLINHVTMIFAAVYCLGGFLFRKNVANDLIDWKFSIIGCMIGALLPFIILDAFFDNIKILVVVSLIGWLAGGFGGGLILPDGEAEGST